MTVLGAPQRRYFLGHHETRSLLARREHGEVALLTGGVVVGVLASLAAGGSPAGLAVLAACVASAVCLVYLPVRGRTLYRWLPLDAAYLAALVSGRRSYRSQAPDVGVDLLTGVPFDVPAPPAVGQLVWLPALSRLGELVALVQRDGSVCIALEIEGPGLGLSDAPDQESAGRRWGTLLRDLANGEGLIERLSLLERSVPSDAEAHQRYVDKHGWVPAPPELISSYDELHRSVGSVSEQHRNFCVVRLRGGRDLTRAVRLAGGGDPGLTVVAAREAEQLAARLQEADIKVLRALDEPAVAGLMRSQYAPWRSMDDVAGLSRRDAWPTDARATPRHLAAEGWCHATAWIRSWPLVPVGVDFLAPLLVQTPGVVRTVVVTLGLVPTDRAMSKVMSDLTSDAATASTSARAGRTADPRDGRQLSQAEQRAHDVAQGAAGVTLVGWVTVSARDEEQLEASRRQLRTAAARSWLTLEWCDKEHDTAFVNTLPLARGLR